MYQLCLVLNSRKLAGVGGMRSEETKKATRWLFTPLVAFFVLKIPSTVQAG